VATAVSATQINLSWTDNSNNETGFKVERSSNGTTFTQISTLGVNVTTYASTGLSTSTKYYYRVGAYNSGGDSKYSNTVNATTLAAPTPTPTSQPRHKRKHKP
jgi:acid phosphatase type 7